MAQRFLRVERSGQSATAVARYNATVSMALQSFFMKSKLVVDVVSPFPPHEEPKRIHARMTPTEFKDEEARTFFVSIRNEGRKTAEDVKPFLLIAGTTGMVPLVIVQPQGKPWMGFAWPGTPEEFDNDEYAIATALIYNEKTREESVTLNPNGSGRAFILFFTLRGKNRIFFPSEAKVSVEIPCRLGFELLFEMRDGGISHSKRFIVDVQAWDSFHVGELKPKSPLHFFRKSSQ